MLEEPLDVTGKYNRGALCEQKMREGIDTGYSMLKRGGATPSARFGACHSKNTGMNHRYHLNVVFQYMLEYYIFEVIEMKKIELTRPHIILLIIFFMLVSSGTWAILFLLKMGTGSDDAWLDFWGNYIGAIISGLIAFFVANYQIEKEYRERIAEKKWT